METKFNGWKTTLTIHIVVKNPLDPAKFSNANPDNFLPKGYIVFGDDKKQMESALKWAGANYKVLKDIPNRDFTLELYSAAGGSYQGGKLSFWMCLIGNIPGCKTPILVGINSEVLCGLIKESTFVNGMCTHKVMFAKLKGETCVIHKDTKAYQELLTDSKSRAALKTQKAELDIGRCYSSLQLQDVYLGKALQYIEFKSSGPDEYVVQTGKYKKNPAIFTIHTKPKKVHVLAQEHTVRDVVNSAENIAGHHIDTLTEAFNILAEAANSNSQTFKEMCKDGRIRRYNIKMLLNVTHLKRTVPKRFSGNYLMNMQENPDEFQKAFIRLQSQFNRFDTNATYYLDSLRDRSRYGYQSTNSAVDFYLSSMESIYGTVPEGAKIAVPPSELKEIIVNTLNSYGISPDSYQIIVD